MFTDPQSITVSTVAHTLPRTASEGRSSTYTKDDDTRSLEVSHTESKNSRIRHLARSNFNKIAADPFVSGNSRLVGGSVYLVVDEPNKGEFTNAELLAEVKGFVAWCTDANVNELLAGEH